VNDAFSITQKNAAYAYCVLIVSTRNSPSRI